MELSRYRLRRVHEARHFSPPQAFRPRSLLGKRLLYFETTDGQVTGLIQAGDFDLYLRTKIRSLRQGDIRPVHVALGVFNHHYIRQTAKAPRPAFKDQTNLLPLQQKWGHTAKDLLTYISWAPPEPA